MLALTNRPSSPNGDVHVDEGTEIRALTPPPNRQRQGEAWESGSEAEAERVKKEAVEAKISAWENAKVATANNRFKREDAVINGWENEQVLKSTSWINKVERRLEEKRVRAMEKMQNEIAKAHGKAEERRATAEARRGSKVAEVLQFASRMRVAGTPPPN